MNVVSGGQIWIIDVGNPFFRARAQDLPYGSIPFCRRCLYFLRKPFKTLTVNNLVDYRPMPDGAYLRINVFRDPHSSNIHTGKNSNLPTKKCCFASNPEISPWTVENDWGARHSLMGCAVNQKFRLTIESLLYGRCNRRSFPNRLREMGLDVLRVARNKQLFSDVHRFKPLLFQIQILESKLLKWANLKGSETSTLAGEYRAKRLLKTLGPNKALKVERVGIKRYGYDIYPRPALWMNVEKSLRRIGKGHNERARSQTALAILRFDAQPESYNKVVWHSGSPTLAD